MEDLLTLTNVIIGITVATSVIAFSSDAERDKMLFDPYIVKRKKEYYRFISSGLIHGDWWHLLFNMFTFYSFGTLVELYYKDIFGSLGAIVYLVLYFGGMVASEMITYKTHQDNPHYRNLGASGAVSSVLFSFILFDPWAKLYLMFIPVGIPAVLLGVAYMAYSYYASQRVQDGIAHDVHFYGALFGLLFTIVMKPAVLLSFVHQLMGQ
ncbi:MAG: rhomboid family intramembrane serine protease [Chitinophagales bacterium]|jgi:membrane associated rhomboid family serine protease|nr:rhomboid family intramembrane serine protease [Sphingobacteriales bacterium]MBP7533185.1 rhomboid family intramembrane serine protease [Chitinophagales bacterium]